MASSEGHCHTSENNAEDDEWIAIERVYKEKSNEEERLIDWLTKNVDIYLPSSVSSGVTEKCTSIEKYSLLSFGCGDGTKDRAILQAISSRLSEKAKIAFHAVDPSSSQIEKFKKAVGRKREETLKNVQFRFFPQTFENHMQNKSKDEDFIFKPNLILFIDSLCHFSSSPEAALVHCYKNVLAKNGIMLITLWNNEDFWFKIRETYGKGKNTERKAEEGNDYLTIQEVEEVVIKHGWNFQLFSPEYSLDITECFNASSKDGRHLMDCLAWFSNVKDEVDSDPKKLLKFLQESESISQNKHLLKGKQGALFIYKRD